MLHTFKSTLKSFAKHALDTYRQRGSLAYFTQKTQDYLAHFENLQPLPQDHKQAVSEYWAPLGGGAYKTFAHA